MTKKVLLYTSKRELCSSVVSKQVVNIVTEISDRDRRKCNLMVHNLPEPEQPSAQERTSANTKTVEGLIKGKLSVTDVKICKVLRLGKCKEKARQSLLVVFDDEKTKSTCLRRASRLKDDAVFQKFIYVQT